MRPERGALRFIFVSGSGIPTGMVNRKMHPFLLWTRLETLSRVSINKLREP